MSNPFFDRPILNSPYGYPVRHWELDEAGQPTQKIIELRRGAKFVTPIPKPKKRKAAAQADFIFDEGKGLSTETQQYDPTSIINKVRSNVDAWRRLPNPAQWQVTPETARLLQHWRHHDFGSVRPFFCQVEAVETAIWLTEVAPQSRGGKRLLDHLAAANRDANPQLMRLALKLATGAGKTTVMAMLIAWQTINAARREGSKNFTRGFLVCAPGLTIKDRLRVLQPSDPESYYAGRELVPGDLLDDVKRAKIVITNYHAFKLRERIELSKGGRQLLQGRTGDELETQETEGQMLQRVMPDLMGMKNILVINDEAHHCYREKPTEPDDEDLKGEERKEAEKNNEAARLWISGLEAVNRKLGLSRVIDLSATPYFLRGSGYLTYLRDRLTVARDLLADTGSIFVQIGDENMHRVRSVLDEVFGPDNCCGQITVVKTAGQSSELIAGTADFLLWFSKQRSAIKFRNPLLGKGFDSDKAGVYRWVRGADGIARPLSDEERSTCKTDGVYRLDNLTSQRPPGSFPVTLNGKVFGSGKGYWKTGEIGMARLIKANRIAPAVNSLTYVRFIDDFKAQEIGNVWSDTGTGSFTDEKIYVVQSGTKLVQRCLLMATDPGDLVLDPTCGSGTTATVAEQWGRRWITIDTSRVALALARARIMGARYQFYLLADSRDGQIKEAEITRTPPSSKSVQGNIRHGFIYERVPHVTLKAIANNAEIEVIWDQWQAKLEPLRAALNAAIEKQWQEWEIPREAEKSWPEPAKKLHAEWWQARIARQKEIDASIAAKAEFEYLYDKPYDDKKKVRVAGPFTVESLSPHRILGVDENDELIDELDEDGAEYRAKKTFPEMILENLKTAGVQQAHKEDRISFTALTLWPGDLVCAEGRYLEGATEKRAAIFIGPEFGTVQRADLVAAAREAGDGGFDVLIACAFNYEAHTTEFTKLGRIPVLKARMNADLHMAEDLKNTGAGNLFVIFGEPDIDLIPEKDGKLRVKVNGVDVFKPQTGEVISDNADGIACWFIDTDYNEESFFVRHAYFLGANDPYSALKTTLRAEIDPEAWSTLHSDISRPFDKPSKGRIAVKVINHLGDEVMKVFKVQ